MNTFTVTATELKNNTARILNTVQYSGKTALIKKHSKIVARIKPASSIVDKKTLEKRKRLFKKFSGSVPDFPEIHKERYDREKDLTL